MGGGDDDMVIATLRWRHDAHDKWMMFVMMFTMMLMMILMMIFMMIGTCAKYCKNQ